MYSNGIVPSSNTRITVRDNSFENARASTITNFVTYQGIEGEFYNNYFWGNATTAVLGSAVQVGQCINPIKIANNVYEYNISGMTFAALASIGCVEKDSSFGMLYGNTTDLYIAGSSIPDYIFKTVSEPSSGLVVDETYLEEMVVGSKIAFTNYNGLTNDDRVIYSLGKLQRTGDGLPADTTVHTSGTGKFAMRFKPTSTAGNVGFTQTIPTGNIQNLTMVITAWVKINSSTYYSDVYVNPTLSVNYDDGTTSTAVATNSTDWQQLIVSFTPTTTTGIVIATIGGTTNATGTDAYFYVDDVNVFYPPGIQLALGGLDLWANALPVTPSISTNVNAADVWNIQQSVLTGTGTIGKGMIDIKKINLNKITRAGNIVDVFEDDTSTLWKQYNLASNGRIEI
jgi:hypothetical protein